MHRRLPCFLHRQPQRFRDGVDVGVEIVGRTHLIPCLHAVIARSSCDEAIQPSSLLLDCFAALAMTNSLNEPAAAGAGSPSAVLLYNRPANRQARVRTRPALRFAPPASQ